LSTKIGANLLVQIQKIEVFQESSFSWTGMSGCAGDGGQLACKAGFQQSSVADAGAAVAGKRRKPRI